MESTSFYMTLPSSTRSGDDMYPKNTASAFQVRLPKTMYLKNKYEVALAEIMYPHTWSTFNKNEDYTFYYTHLDGDAVRLSIDKGYYLKMDALLREMNQAFQRQMDEKLRNDIVFHYNGVTGRVKLFMKGGYTVWFSEGLADILGFKSGEVYRASSSPEVSIMSPFIADITRGFNSLYIYCSICEPQIVGDAYVPLLRTVFLSGRHGQMINHIYDAPHYVPVNTDTFDTIEINIKNDMNENVSFKTGKVICKLHFRQKAL